MKSYSSHIFGLIWRQKKKLFIWIPLMLIEIGSRIVQPYFSKYLIDTLTQGLVSGTFSDKAMSGLLMIIVIWLIVAIVFNIVHGFEEVVVWEIGNRSSQWTHLQGYKKLLNLDYYKHTQKHSSRYAKIVDDADNSTWEMTNWWLGRFIKGGIGFLLMLAVAFSVSWQMTLVALAAVPCGLAIIIFQINKYELEQRRVNKLWEIKHEHMSDQITNIITYKLNQDEDRFMNVQSDLAYKGADAQMALNKKWALTDMLNPDAIARFLVMAMGVYWVKNGVITLGTLFMFMALVTEILMPLHFLGDILPQYSRRARHIEKFLRLVETESQIVDSENAESLKFKEGKIEFKNVDFAYSEKGREIINNLSFTISPGEHVAMVGHSGSGKSTVMTLLTRLVDPVKGEVLLDGENIKNFKQHEYRNLFGTVLQENSLYNETVAENISYGKPDATREEVMNAARMAAADEFIEKLKDGYDTLIGERGVRLSGGEKQRLAIARAMIKNPKIVVLDEPTSALDSITEAKVQLGLDKLIEGRSALIIAHRLSTVKSCDKILVLHDGKLVASGSHNELMHSCPEYQKMVELQTGGFLADE